MSAATPPKPMDLLPLQQQVARLQALLEASRQVHSTIDAGEVLTQTARILVRELEMEGAVFLAPSSGKPLGSYGTQPAPPYDDCPRFDLISRDGPPLAVLVIQTPQGAPLSLYEQDFVEGLVLQAAVALENATNHERNLKWARLQQDLDAARGIQRSLLPKCMPAIPAYSIAGRSSACYEVGGDYLDTVRLPDGSQLFVVADVAGKGLASAIVAMSFRSAFRSLASQPMTLEEVATRVGQQHWDEGSEAQRRYVTAIFVRLDETAGALEVVNAGHNPAALIFADGSTLMIEASGTPLGMLPGMHYRRDIIPFPPGSRLLLYTDGLTEVFCGDDEFGCERLIEAFGTLSLPDAQGILDFLWAELASFAAEAPQTDDMTALVICHLTPAQQETPFDERR